MAQIKNAGSLPEVTVTNASQTVILHGYNAVAELAAGQSFHVKGEADYYEVASTTPTWDGTNTTFYLTGVYSGTTKGGLGSGVYGVVATGYTANHSIIEMDNGDVDTLGIFTRAVRKIDELFTSLLTGVKQFTAINITGFLDAAVTRAALGSGSVGDALFAADDIAAAQAAAGVTIGVDVAPYIKHTTSASLWTANDDTTQGYTEGASRWQYTGVSPMDIYVLVDGTPGAAVWEKMNVVTGDLGSMALQNANAVAISGGDAVLNSLGADTSSIDDNLKTQRTVINFASDANYTLTAAQNSYSQVEMADTGVILTTAKDVLFDATPRLFSFINSAAQILTPKVSGGAGPAIPADGLIYQLYSDGTDVTYRGTQNPVFHVREEQASGTDGGASIAGNNIRVLNTVVTNTISGASLASNQVTLPAGNYKVTATTPMYRGGANKITLYNVTDASVDIVGSNSHSSNSDATMSIAHITEGRIDISATKTFEVRHYITTAVATNGLGVAITSGDVEVYAELIFEKIG